MGAREAAKVAVARAVVGTVRAAVERAWEGVVRVEAARVVAAGVEAARVVVTQVVARAAVREVVTVAVVTVAAAWVVTDRCG